MFTIRHGQWSIFALGAAEDSLYCHVNVPDINQIGSSVDSAPLIFQMNKVPPQNGPLSGLLRDITPLLYCIGIYLRHSGAIAFLYPLPALLINATLRDLGPLSVNLITFQIER